MILEEGGIGQRILIIDDDAGLREFLSLALEDEGYEVGLAAEGAAALGLVSTFNPALILLDLRMPVMDGRAFLEAYHKLNQPLCPIIIFSAALLGEPPIEATVYVPKPFDLNDLFTHISTLLNRTASS